MNITAPTSSSGERRPTMSLVPYAFSGMRPDALVEMVASMSPISIEPESPMKIRAGWKLCGRNPRHAPARAAAMSAGG